MALSPVFSFFFQSPDILAPLRTLQKFPAPRGAATIGRSSTKVSKQPLTTPLFTEITRKGLYCRFY